MAESIALLIDHIEAKPGSGAPRIKGKGVRVDFIANLVESQGAAIDTVCQEYGLTPGEVYAALSYYADHKEELDQAAREAEERLDRRFAENPELDSLRQAIIERNQP